MEQNRNEFFLITAEFFEQLTINKNQVMKKSLAISIFLVCILGLSASLNAQQKTQPLIHGKDLVVPFATGKIDSLNPVSLGKDELMKVKKIICSNKNYKVTSFDFIAAVEGHIVYTQKSTNDLTSDISTNISKLKSGDKIWIESVTVKGPDGKLTMLKNIVFKVS